MIVLFIYAINKIEIDYYNNNLIQEEVIMDMFNGQEVKVEGWMIQDIDIGGYAKKWCITHSIPANEQEAKCKELTDRFRATIGGLKIKLVPLPEESE